jgi:glutathione synthase/RimK-type ligase-like ATP-grasp enzyme
MEKMKIAILHHDIEPAELKFKEIFESRGCLVELFDIRRVEIEELISYDLLFNRVYSSVASRDFKSLNKTLNILKELEGRGVRCVNSSVASYADYSKYELFLLLSAHGVFTPPSIFLGSRKDIKKISKRAISEFGFPIVVKRNCGGKSYEVTRVYSLEEMVSTINRMFDTAKAQNYKGGFIIQKYIQAIRPHDCRIGIVEGKFLFAYSRSFVARNSEDSWIASTSGGSKESLFNPTDEEIEEAKKAKKAINAGYGESDVIMTKDGPCVIEVNPTPGYFIDSPEDLERMEMVVDELINNSNTININNEDNNKVKIVLSHRELNRLVVN